jgi:Fur family transcriptional regulator, peroxide stress response regulator
MARKARISAAMLALMKTSDHHAWTLEAIQAELAGRGAPADFSSIFRAAERLLSEGAIIKVLLDDGRSRFELVAAHHDHLHCTACDTLVPVPCVIEGTTSAALEAETGVAISRHHIVFSGLCADCRADETSDRGRQ